MLNIIEYPVQVELLKDGRSLRLLKTYYFTDSKGITWIAHEGSVVDGASIPRSLWSLSGSPLVGKYRDASIVHDVYCVSREHSHEATHHMFWELMIASGVSDWKAQKMWVAVNLGGPKWDEDGLDLEALDYKHDMEEW